MNSYGEKLTFAKGKPGRGDFANGVLNRVKEWSLQARKINAYPVFILITEKGEYQTFMQVFGKHFQQVRI